MTAQFMKNFERVPNTSHDTASDSLNRSLDLFADSFHFLVTQLELRAGKIDIMDIVDRDQVNMSVGHFQPYYGYAHTLAGDHFSDAKSDFFREQLQARKKFVVQAEDIIDLFLWDYQVCPLARGELSSDRKSTRLNSSP